MRRNLKIIGGDDGTRTHDPLPEPEIMGFFVCVTVGYPVLRPSEG